MWGLKNIIINKYRAIMGGGLHNSFMNEGLRRESQRETNPSMRPKVETEKPGKGSSTSCRSMLSVLSNTQASSCSPHYDDLYTYTQVPIKSAGMDL